MRKTNLLIAAGVASGMAGAKPIPILNPSGEVNPGTSPTAISNPAVIGWNGSGSGAQVIKSDTDFGNGAWRLSIEDSVEAWQMTPHVIAAGDAFSLRFDAAMFSGNLPGGGSGFVPTGTLVGGALRNGDFNDPAVTGNSFAELPEWQNLGGAQTTEASKTDLAFDGTRNAVMSNNGTRKFAVDTGHTLAAGEIFRVGFVWRDASNWDDAADTVAVTLYTTDSNTIDGARTVLQTLQSPASTQDSTYEQATLTFNAVAAAAAGKRLFAFFEGIDGNPANTTNIGFARLDNFTLERGTNQSTVPERQIIAELYVDDGGARLPVASRTYDFKTPVAKAWDHYHLAVPAAALDAHAGKTVGVRFRSNDQGIGNFQSFDNVRLDVWPTVSPDGSFSDNWNSTPNQTWAGPGYWANRLQDWEVSGNRVQCINGARERLTLHRPGTSIRGNGGNFTLGVRTGVNTGTSSAGSRAGFLLGAAPNVDWRGALLVHDGMGRDFGLFLGITGNGNLVIEDYSTGAVTALATSAVTGGFVQNTRLSLAATYNPAPGTYTLALTAFNSGGTQTGTVSFSVPSDRVLGAFGLLSHFGTSAATHWFDDFSGTGSALNPEPDRHLAIIGAMHTLSKGKLKLTAQLSPISLASSPSVALDTWNGSAWNQIATAPVDNTDNLSSYTATFSITGWNDKVDTPYRLRVSINGTDYPWTGTIRRDPVEKEKITLAMVTCQRINDGNLQNNGFDWSPVMLWHPHTQSYGHIAKHNPDVLLAHGDQIYEGQPTNKDSNSGATNRQLDYLYKWNLWVLQARELTRDIPTVAIPDDHDVFQGNLWGEGGVTTNTEALGGYVEPASWVKMVERTQTSNLPDPDPYNPVQPAPAVAQGIKVYFTGMTYGRLGFAILEDRKFKTGPNSPPSDPAQQHMLGERQHDFLREWNKDWRGQDLKLVVSQSPLAMLNTHASAGYNFRLTDRDAHGWPVHRRNDAWRLLRASRMFQLAGDQHVATLAHHGTDSPRDAGISFAAPAMANFFPRIFDPVHNASGTTPTVSPYLGDYFFNGNGTLPDGVTPNLTASDPHHFAILGAGNSDEYYQRTSGINPPNYHDRGAGYGITRVNKTTREITFESWPIHADPEYPQTGSQFADWPQTYRQTDNDGRVPTGFLPVIDTLWRENPVVRVFDETSGELVHAMRVRGTRYRPPVYDNGTTYRVEIAYGDAPVSETLNGQTAAVAGAPAIQYFGAVQPSILLGGTATLEWDVISPATLTIDQGLGDVLPQTVDGIGFARVSPQVDTTYTLTLNGGATATTTVRVFGGRAAWDDAYFTPADKADPEIFGGGKDPDGDGFSNDEEFQFQTNPRDSSSRPRLQGSVKLEGSQLTVDFDMSYPVDPAAAKLIVETSPTLQGWQEVPANSYVETGRENFPSVGTSRVLVRLTDTVSSSHDSRFYRARWELR
ncbi:alkaline phosphatase D family protein [Akkermansiaceae bacterium]|nr:alkaline phosphatase D family protein [Akkermansiaceae bacterium]